jgi:CRISPR-associated exonuclease Cas4
MQLAAYCVLVEETSKVAPPYGLLRYAEQTFRLDYTEQVREEVLALLDQMRDDLDQPDCDRSHDDERRCLSCGFFEACEQALDPESA